MIVPLPAATPDIFIDLLHEAMAALELCLDEDDLTFSSEQAADRAISRIKAVIL